MTTANLTTSQNANCNNNSNVKVLTIHDKTIIDIGKMAFDIIEFKRGDHIELNIELIAKYSHDYIQALQFLFDSNITLYLHVTRLYNEVKALHDYNRLLHGGNAYDKAIKQFAKAKGYQVTIHDNYTFIHDKSIAKYNNN